MCETPGYTPFEPRDIRFQGLREVRGHRLKIYSIVQGDRPFVPAPFEGGLHRAYGSFPEAAPEAGRPGLGFVILHQGFGDYVVLCWWDRENELPTRVFVRADDLWRPARGGESFCVWDLQVMWYEREAYVSSLLARGGSAAADTYLSRRLTTGSR